MIIAPLNDHDCLAKLSALAADGQARDDVRSIAGRFRTTGELAAWIRSLPQRDDDGDPDDGPRVGCDTAQRARLIADDPNCVERSILYIAAAEVIDPQPVRQLATIEVPSGGRHTFPVENGTPIKLDPAVPRNALRAGLWMIRNGGAIDDDAPTDPDDLLEWVADIAEEVADKRDGARGVRRVRRARRIFGALLDGFGVSRPARSDALYTLRAAAEAAPMFGQLGAKGIRVARRGIARLMASQIARETIGRIPPKHRERAAYLTGKAVATAAGVGGLYDFAYAVGRATAKRPAPMPGTLNALEARKGSK